MTSPSVPDSPAVIERLVHHHREFLAFLERRVGSREEAEDILQDGFARALERGDSLRTDESAVAWFYRLLRNAVVDHYRRRGARDRAHQRAASREDDATAIDDQELFQTVCGCVTGLARNLKPEYADALREVDLEGRSLADYAARAGITPGNAAVRVHRAREALRTQVIRACGTCAEHGCEDCRCGS